MPKNKGKGGKNRRRGKNENESTKRELLLKEPQQEYAIVKALTGNGKLTLHCMDGVERVGLIRGKLRKKIWIGVGDTILVSLRDYQDNMCDAVFKYNNDEVRILKSKGHVIDIGSENKSEVIEFKNDSGMDVTSSKNEILDDIMGAHNPNRPVLSAYDDESDETSSEEEDSEEEDSEEEEESEEEETEEEEDDQPVEISKADLKEALKSSVPVNYSVNSFKQEASNLSNLAVQDEDESESEPENKLPDDLLNKLRLLKQEFKGKN